MVKSLIGVVLIPLITSKLHNLYEVFYSTISDYTSFDMYLQALLRCSVL